jgi:hypothetical protein
MAQDASDTPNQANDESDDDNSQKQKKQKLGQARRRAGYSAKAENPGDHRNNKKDKRIIQHA